ACRPKCGQPGRTRCELSRRSAVSVPCSHWFFLRKTLTCTCSPGNAPSMNTTLPSARCATPWPSRSSDSTCNHSSLANMAGIIGSAPRGATNEEAARRRPRRSRLGDSGLDVVGDHLPLAVDDLRQPRGIAAEVLLRPVGGLGAAEHVG